MKFILSRTEDYRLHSKKWIVGYGLLFWLITRIIAAGFVIGCTAVYNAFGVNPEEMTKFGGDPSTVKSVYTVGYGIALAILIAPVMEECIFRLGLSFRKWQISLGLAAIPAYMIFQVAGHLTIWLGIILGCIAVGVLCGVYFITTQEYWNRVRKKYFRVAVWLTAIAFGLMHLIAFSPFSFELLPYMLCVILVPFFAGCAITYYRVNLGFWWGVGLHIFNNLPALLLLCI